MANTYVDYTATAGQTDFAFSFPYLEDEHVEVLIDGVKTTAFSLVTTPSTKVVLNSGATSGQIVRIRRNSDPTVNLVDFVNGSVLTESELDRAYQHNRYLNEEAFEGNTSSLQVLEGTTNFNANFNKIVNLAPPTTSLDAANKDYVDDKLALSGTSLSGFNKSSHTGDGTSDQFTLSFTPQTGTASAFRVAIDGVLQTPDDAYTINSGTSQITFTSAPPVNAEIVVVATGTAQDVNSIGVTATGSTTARTLSDRFGQVLTPYDFGAVGNGSDDDTDALQAWIAYLNADAKNVGELGKGAFAFNTTLELTRTGVGIMGSQLKGRRTGSTRLASTLVWTGGADPMFRVSTAQHTFAYVGVESNGSATDFLELNAGHIDLVMNNVFFSGAGLFTRSVIRSNGNRLGYSSFNEVHCSSRTADKFIDIDGQGSSGGITPIEFTRCTFIGSSSSGSTGTNPWTVLHIKDERIEAVSFERCTFISRDGLLVVDTTDSPITDAIRSLRVENCEFDEFTTNLSSQRMFKLENCHNVSFSNNIITGLSTVTDTALCSLINSNVSRFESNWIEGVQYVFDNDSNSKINGIGINYSDWSSVQGIMLNATNWYIDLTQSLYAELDGAYLTPNTSGNFICEVTSDTAYGFNLDKSRPQNWEAGQLFYLTIKNTSGGAVSANPTFFSGNFEVQSSTITTPSNGHQVTILFRFDGTKAIQISQISPEVDNA
jgi:hypothetical protein